MSRLGAWDMSSFMWTHLSVGKDDENGFVVEHDGKTVQINSARYGYDNCMTRMIDLLKKYKLAPIKCLLVFEGAMSKSQRLLISKDYKGGGGPSRPQHAYEQFEKMRDMLKETWKGLGAQIMWQDYAEGDDTLAWLARETEEDMIVFTFDNDLTSLNHTNTHGAKVSTWINQMFEYSKYGAFDYHLVTTYKALVGDTSDKIKGCPGFGVATWDKLVAEIGYDGVQEIHDMLLDSNLSPLVGCVNGFKPLQLIVDQAPTVLQSFDLARLRPEWVNTMHKPLTWEPGMVRQVRPHDDIRLKPFYGKTHLVTAENFDEAVAWALPHIAQSEEIALDIETTTPDESDEWLALIGDTDGVDVFGSTLCGLGLTFGVNNQCTIYFSVDHADTDNIDSERVRQFIAAIPRHIPLVIQNVSFELAVLFNEWGGRQMDNGFHGFLPNVLDTKFEANYVDENIKVGLKERSHGTLGYRQQTFKETTVLTRPQDELFPGGRTLSYQYKTQQVGTGHFEPLSEEEIAAGAEPVEMMKTVEVLEPTGRMLTARCDIETYKRLEYVYATEQEIEDSNDLDPSDQTPELDRVIATETRQYKMHELPAWHVAGYGADDPICTIALHNYYKLFMQFEHTYEVYKQVEISAAYMHAKSFITGADISIERMNELKAEDDKTYQASWAVLREYLIEQGWAGTSPPNYTIDITPAQVKEAFEIVTGRPMNTQMRTLSKLVIHAREVENEPQFAGMLDLLITVQTELRTHPETMGADQVRKAEQAFTSYVSSYFKGEPQFNDGSPKQMQNLLYGVMGLPVRVRNKPTDIMRKAGITEGTPKTDTLAISYALQECEPGQKKVLEALQLMAMVGTRNSLYYAKYPSFPHWKDGKVRSSHNQCSTVTRRASESRPNKQQLPKHPKIEGHASKFREVIVPHRPDAVIVSIDFKAQELRIMADRSKDPVMLSMYIGDNKRDQHTLTASAIAQREQPDSGWSYEVFAAAYGNKDHPEFKWVKKIRNLGKKLNFTAEYGAMAQKVALTLMISEADAQLYLDAREDMFAVSSAWKLDVIKSSKECGYTTTMMGARRHLAPAYTGSDKWVASKAERQGVNFEIQGSAGEQTKLAEGRCWEDGMFCEFDAVFIGPIHDELVASVRICDLVDFIPRMHACMVAPYGGMTVPIEGDISFGLDFYNQVEIGAVPSREAIEAGLEAMWKGRAERDAEKLKLKEAA